MRGSRSFSVVTEVGAGSIPACAGQPRGIRGSCRAAAVYPRVCGAAKNIPTPTYPLLGLSPRVRGSPQLAVRQHHAARSIPACAGQPRIGLRLRPCREVYPRVCGAASHPHTLTPGGHGLSPRVRGSQRTKAPLVRRDRSIPACAGQPHNDRNRSRWRPVYPRVCGAAGPLGGWINPAQGLSPRVRGSLGGNEPTRNRVGSIPACAGQPIMTVSHRTQRTVYPRVCGAAWTSWRSRPPATGLSPRLSRLDYACAGQPQRTHLPFPLHRVYPRVCGAAVADGLSLVKVHGLSPRVRGSPLSSPGDPGWMRSIPACAGQPARRAPGAAGVYPRVRGSLVLSDHRCVCGAAVGAAPAWETSVYPRVCGAAPWESIGSTDTTGLSPRVRGSRPARVLQNPFGGSIPACAGQPLRVSPSGSEAVVYPRVCGAAVSTLLWSVCYRGLSPRVRGSQGARGNGVCASGSIPACAGQPLANANRLKGTGVYPRVCGAATNPDSQSTTVYGLSPRVRGSRRPAWN